ncbi:MAG: hypothetical protein RDU20_15115 [Desulfomonilaceae bacterium]|nr:hypothetical protein [Desulfomonilaceae bacterium]
MTIDNVKYRLKLYGHVTGDADTFARKTAVLLRISPVDVHRLLLDLPVTFKENLGEDAADLLKMQLDALGALTIVEPMEEIVEEARPGRTPQQPAGWDRLGDLWSRGDSDPEARIYAVLLIVAVVLLSGIFTFGYSSSLVKLFQNEAIKVRLDAARHSPGSSRTTLDLDRPTPARMTEIGFRIDELDTQIKSLHHEHDQADMLLTRANSSGSANRRELFERGREVADLRKKIRDAHSELMELERLRKMTDS